MPKLHSKTSISIISAPHPARGSLQGATGARGGVPGRVAAERPVQAASDGGDARGEGGQPVGGAARTRQQEEATVGIGWGIL